MRHRRPDRDGKYLPAGFSLQPSRPQRAAQRRCRSDLSLFADIGTVDLRQQISRFGNSRLGPIRPAQKIRGMYKPTELLVLANQVRAVCLTWITVFLLLAGAIFALKIGSDVPPRLQRLGSSP
jgi:hypothetical protein